MKLSARMLESVSGVNSFEQTTQLSFSVGDAPAVYFQLVDENKNRAQHGYNPPGLRYVPASGATLQVTLSNIDDSRQVVRAATQPFPGDLSIWSVQLTTADLLRGTVHMKLALTEGSQVTYGYVQAALAVGSSTGMSRL